MRGELPSSPMPTLSSFISYRPRRSKPKPTPAVVAANDELVDWSPSRLFDDHAPRRPAPITIPRPTSASSSVDTASSAVSGATFARALMANTFALSTSPARDSRPPTRTDSATLPGCDFLQSPLPDAAGAADAVPPVPGNAEHVYVPPRLPRAPDAPPALHVVPVAPETPSLASAIASALGLPPPSPSPGPSPAADIDGVIDCYINDPRAFHPPFSPITEETSAQLTPPAPYTKSPPPRRTHTDRFFLPAGRTSASAAGGAYLVPTLNSHAKLSERTASVGWTVRPPSAASAHRDSLAPRPLLPLGAVTRSRSASAASSASASARASPTPSTSSAQATNRHPVSPLPESVTNSFISLHPHPKPKAKPTPDREHTKPPAHAHRTVPSPIRVVKHLDAGALYDLGGGGGADEGGARAVVEAATHTRTHTRTHETFPETPTAFSPLPPPSAAGAPAAAVRGPSVIGEYPIVVLPVPYTPVPAPADAGHEREEREEHGMLAANTRVQRARRSVVSVRGEGGGNETDAASPSPSAHTPLPQPGPPPQAPLPDTPASASTSILYTPYAPPLALAAPPATPVPSTVSLPLVSPSADDHGAGEPPHAVSLATPVSATPATAGTLVPSPASSLSRTPSPLLRPSQSDRRPPTIVPPPPDLVLPPALSSVSSHTLSTYDYTEHDAAASPPPYRAATPSTGGCDASSAHHPHGELAVPAQQRDRAGLAQGAARRQRRLRPPLPAGPRRPRDRAGSVSSVSSQPPVVSQPQTPPQPQPPQVPAHVYPPTPAPPHPPTPPPPPPPPPPSPQFATPAPDPKWRGYTLEAARWTFTSQQLQSIVSRAIRQSSEASSIRLLRLDTLETEVPAETRRLEARRAETIEAYKALARRRGAMLAEAAAQPDAARARLEALRGLCGALDRAAEELHALDEQLAQLRQVAQVHAASALAMALRKLNVSFLKQLRAAQELRHHVESLEAQRDDAWTHAAAVAAEYDDLKSGKALSPEDAENRFDKVMAVRKVSVRAAKAGLRSASTVRANHLDRASTLSIVRGFSVNTPIRTPCLDDLPPVPPLPRHRPLDISTNIPSRNSAVTGVSTEFPSPNSDMGALQRAQDELYDMLGIPRTDRIRRSRSLVDIRDSEYQQVTLPCFPNYDAPPNTGRRASLPPSASPTSDPYTNASIMWASDRAGWI